MSGPSASPRVRSVPFTDRISERGVLERLVADVGRGDSGALVVHGEPGVGKTALLDYLTEHAPDCRVIRVAGVQSEMELAFAGLHQLCAPILDGASALPGPQRDALRITFGVTSGPVPDRFLVGLAVLGLLTEAAARQPLICVVDDEQWLDRASVQMLAFVARRLGSESLGLVFGTRAVGRDLAGLTELAIPGLAYDFARTILETVFGGPMDERVRDRIIAETRGNPLALLELPRGLTATELAGGFALPRAMDLSESIEESFRRRSDELPPESGRLLLIASADPVGDPVLVWRAAGRLGIGAEAARPAIDAGLVEFGTRVRFRHPLVRSAVYWSASDHDRREAHRVLAEATDLEVDPDRGAWHRAHAASGPDEQVAGGLERSAARAQGRGGLAASAAFLERAMLLTPDQARRAQRALAAARAAHQAGAPRQALSLLEVAAAGPLSDFECAEVDLIRAQIALTVTRGGDTVSLLLKAAARLEAFDVRLARETYLDALLAAMFAGHLTTGTSVRDAAEAVRFGPPARDPSTPADLLLDGLAIRFTDGYAVGAPHLRTALNAFGAPVLSADEMRWLWLAHIVAGNLWDEATLDTDRHVQLAREAGALDSLPLALTSRIGALVITGELDAAALVVDELEAVSEATGIPVAAYGSLLLAAWRGRSDELLELIDRASIDLVRRGEGFGLIITGFAHALFCNSVGRYDAAMKAAQEAREYPPVMGVEPWSLLVELIEAGTRTDHVEQASDAFRRLIETTRVAGTDWAIGMEARCRALLSSDQEAEGAYHEAIERLGRTRIRGEAARAHLLYGEWLRRIGRRVDARGQLRLSHDMFTAMGMEAFAARARRELRATGENIRPRRVDSREQLTAQETHVAQLARDGLSNPEIGARLFISARTVQYHLSHVFAKLGITSRSQLHRVLK